MEPARNLSRRFWYVIADQRVARNAVRKFYPTFAGTIMRFSNIVAVGAVLAAVPVFVADAQTRDTDSTGFRAGQWGAEFSLATVSDYATGAGVVRFLSDRHALVVDLTGQDLGGLTLTSGVYTISNSAHSTGTLTLVRKTILQPSSSSRSAAV